MRGWSRPLRVPRIWIRSGVLLGIPAEVTPVGVIALGYRAQDIPSPSLKRGRKSDEEYVHRERW